MPDDVMIMSEQVEAGRGGALSAQAVRMVRDGMADPDRARPFLADTPEWLRSTRALANMTRTLLLAHDRLTPENVDLEAVYLSACFHQARAAVVDPEVVRHDAAAAAALFSVVHAVRPDAVPEPLRSAYAESPPALLSPATILYRAGAVLMVEGTRARDVKLLEQAVGLIVLADRAGFDPDVRPSMLFAIGSLFLQLGLLTGDKERFEKAVGFIRWAVSDWPADRPLPRRMLRMLAAARAGLPEEASPLKQRFSRYLDSGTKDPAELAALIADTRAALVDTGPGDPDWHLNRNILASLLRIRFELAGEADDIDQSIALLRETLETTDDRAITGMLNSALASACLDRHIETDDPDDLAAAIAAGRASVAASLPHEPGHPKSLTNLAAVLQASYNRTGDLAELDEAIGYLEIAVDAEVAGTGDHQVMRIKLAVGLLLRALETDREADLDDAARLLESVAVEEPVDGVNQHQARLELSRVALVRAALSRRPEELYSALVGFRDTAQAASHDLRTRLHAGGHWADAAERFGDAEETARAYGYVLDELLPKSAGLALDRRSRELRLRHTSGYACDAAWAELRCGRVQNAIVRLEQGRGVLLTQALRLRGAREALAEAAPGLAERYDRVGAALIADTALPEERSRLAAEFDEVVELIRAVPGFARFGMPADWARLRTAADGGPVVVVNVASRGGDALILRPGGDVTVVALPEVTHDEVARRADAFLHAVDGMSASASDLAARMAHDGVITGTLGWLWKNVAGPVLGAFDVLPERLWWCPTGPLALLPLHAAHRESDGVYVHDLVVSSYTPTLTALIEARTRPPAPDTGLLGVAFAGEPPLLGVAEEVAAIGHDTDPATVLVGADATPGAVLAAMGAHTRVHLACHGVRDPSDPSNGALCLHGGDLTVRELARWRSPGAELAFLSACHTAAAGPELVDEVITLASALRLCGYRHVVGAMWTVQDVVVPQPAVEFHRLLREAGSLAHTATALHAAVDLLRRTPEYSSPLYWACLAHIGP
ncbi:CHAT domain-containing protein [Actinokineospora sp. UTMC 2448]|uniref:CHAT domain-containing protein n=1 Tax=Actinokineospora sp. UTMC 2448 TaxID=2268449 RepID=UPI002164340F|nr:CHAT domain-containing protein [Actinokineospora sp. UTMC 2448]UVS79148.1 CHAT domain protein [Actinokineospora sp. UTMC 2448]